MDHQEAYRQFLAATGLPDEDINLARASLLIAASEYPDLDVDSQLAALDSLAAAASARIGDDGDPFYGVNKLSEYLFDEVGLSGNNDDYYDPRNSYLNDVLTRRIGIPITLSLVCVLVGDRAGIPLQGVGMPGHFLVSHRNEAGLVIDPFHRGIMVSEEECSERLKQVAGANAEWDASYLDPVSNREFLARMLRNLKGIYLQRRDHPRVLSIIDFLVALAPEAPGERRDRGLIHYQLGHLEEALEDLRFYLEATPSGPQHGPVQRLVDSIMQRLS